MRHGVGRLVAMARRAIHLGPAEAGRQAVGVIRSAVHGHRQRADDILRGDPAGAARGARAWSIDERGDGPASPTDLFRREECVLPVAWPGGDSAVSDSMLPERVPDRVRAAAREALEHRFDLLGSGPVRVSYTLEAPGLEGHRYSMAPGEEAARRHREAMARLHSGVREEYDPIDWHVDFRSGYRWDPGTWFRRVPYGHRPGVDVKLPWELSRFQHAGALGLAWRLAPESAEGRAAPAEFRDEVVDWIAANPTRRGVNWRTPMDVALRAVGWLTGIALLDGAPEIDDDFRWIVARSLRAHGLHIEANLEYAAEGTGNHYLADVVGLVAIGAALPGTDRGDRWLGWGLQELVSEMERQVLPDGFDGEGSTAYHRLVTELFLLGTTIGVRLPASRRRGLAALPPASVDHPLAPPFRPIEESGLRPDRDELFPPAYLDRLLRMTEAWEGLLDEGGRFPQIGDHDSGRAWRLEPAPEPPEAFPETGDRAPDDPTGVVAEAAEGRVLAAVAGRLFGKNRTRGRASFGELDARLLLAEDEVGTAREPVERHRSAGSPAAGPSIVRGGDGAGEILLLPAAGLAVGRAGLLRLVATFGTIPEGAGGGHFHDDLLGTVLQWDGVAFLVDGGSYLYTPDPGLREAFRGAGAHSTVAVNGRTQRRWAPPDVSLFLATDDARVELVERGPERLEAVCRYADVLHRRRWEWTRNALVVEDRVEAPGGASIHLNLAPGTEVGPFTPVGEGELRGGLRRRGRWAEVRFEGVTSVAVEPGLYSVGYGRRVENRRVVAPLAGEVARTRLAFDPQCGGAPDEGGTPP